MILVDFNAVAIAALLADKNEEYYNVDLLRHLVLNSLRSCRSRFKAEYGELVICYDSPTWRKLAFPFYKQNRQDEREASRIDWNRVFENIRTIQEEINNVFPYRGLKVEGAEADDIIGVFCHRFGTVEPLPMKDHLIYSSDKDFRQLLKYSNIQQYSPSRKDFITCDDPDGFLFEQILKGDRDDGVPNVRSYDTQLIDKVRQKPVTAKVVAEYQASEELQQSRTFLRNKALIDLTQTPKEIVEKINSEIDREMEPKTRNNIRKYFMDKRLRQLIESIGDF